MIICLSSILFPLIGAFFAGFFGRFFGGFGAALITIFCMIFSFLLSFFIFFKIGLGRYPFYFKLFPWIYSDMLNVSWGFCFDSLTAVMLVVVNTVSLVVHIYSYDYMNKDPHLARFMSFLSLFTFFMLILITADNFVQLFLGWEGVGLCSFLLISFWCTRLQAVKSAIKAFVINRVGDLSLTLGILCIYFIVQSVDFEIIFSLAPYLVHKTLIFCTYELNSLTLISLLLFGGAIGKSAQIGLHVWLPDAMEGPTPVSALIHAATMVTAGVFLVIRCSPLLEFSPLVLILMAFFGGLTCFLSSLIGLLQYDIKKVIAYSTCSQLGYMFFICGLSNYSLALTHLFNHAFFKALLFLSAGTLIHSVSVQDMRLMGGLRFYFPFITNTILLASLALGGFPFFSGFYSKDLIIETSALYFTLSSHFVFYLGVLSALATATYSLKLIYLTFFVKTDLNYITILSIHDIPVFNVIIPFFVLLVGSIFSGYLTSDLLLGFGSDFFCNSIFVLPNTIFSSSLMEVEYLTLVIKCLPLILIFFLFLIIFFTRTLRLPSSIEFTIFLDYQKAFFIPFFIFFNKKSLFDRVFNYLFTKQLIDKSYFLFFESLDKGFLESIGPSGVVDFFFHSSRFLSLQQKGYLHFYLYQMLFFILFFFAIFNECLYFLQLV